MIYSSYIAWRTLPTHAILCMCIVCIKHPSDGVYRSLATWNLRCSFILYFIHLLMPFVSLLPYCTTDHHCDILIDCFSHQCLILYFCNGVFKLCVWICFCFLLWLRGVWFFRIGINWFCLLKILILWLICCLFDCHCRLDICQHHFHKGFSSRSHFVIIKKKT